MASNAVTPPNLEQPQPPGGPANTSNKKAANKGKKPRGRPLKNPQAQEEKQKKHEMKQKQQKQNGKQTMMNNGGEYNNSDNSNSNSSVSGGRTMGQTPPPPNGTASPPVGSGHYPHPSQQQQQYHNMYGGYPPPPGGPYAPRGPHPPPPGSGYPPSGQSISQQGGPTPTLNSLLQNRNNPANPGSSSGYPGYPEENPAYSGAPGGHPGYPPHHGGHPHWASSGDGYGPYRHNGPRPPYGPPHPQQGYPPPPGQGGHQYPHPGGYPPQGPYHPQQQQHHQQQHVPQGQQSPSMHNPASANTQQQQPSPSNDPTQASRSEGDTTNEDDTPPSHISTPANNNSNLPNNSRPTPSPTGSASSRSMSPAVGGPPNSGSSIPTGPHQGNNTTASSSPGGGPPGGPLPPGAMPPRPPTSVAASAGNGPGYPQQPPMGPPSQMMYNKMGHNGPPGSQGGPPNHQMPPYGGQPNPNYPGHPYGMRMHGYGPGGPYPGPQGNNMPIGGGQQHYPGYGQPHHQQQPSTWGGPGGPPPQQQQPGMMGPNGPQKGIPQQQRPRHPGQPGGPQQPPSQQQFPMRSPHPPPPGKGGYPPPPGAPVNSYNGPPSYNGPGMPPPPVSGVPVSSAAPGYFPNSHNSHPSAAMNNYNNSGGPPTSTPSSSSSAPSPVTNSIGPDGMALHDDESSQQSTLSQSSDRSDGRQTPKTNYMPGGGGGAPPVGPGGPGYPHSGGPPGSPHSSVPSPGGSMGSAPGQDNSFHRDMSSPNWQQHQQQGRTSSPAIQSTKMDSLARLFEMDDHPERRIFLNRLLSFMEEKGSPITQCPTISKNPLDLFKLYIYTKERGGFMECTKNKTWKDIAAQLGIGASSSGAYTLKKHYGKNLLPFECHFDRGGMDPGPLLAQVESQTSKKKKGPVHPPPAPSPGSQDSRDSSSNYSGSNQNSQEAYGGSGAPPPGPPGSSGYPPPPGGPPGSYGGCPPYSGGPPSGERLPGAPPHTGPYPPPPHNSGYGGYPGGPPGSYPNNYPPGGGPPRPGWPPSSGGYMGPPNGSASPGPGWNGSYPPRPGFPPPPGQSGPGQPPYSQASYNDQYQKQQRPPSGGPPNAPITSTPSSPSPNAPMPNAPTPPPPAPMKPAGLMPRPQSPQTSDPMLLFGPKKPPPFEQSRPVILRANNAQSIQKAPPTAPSIVTPQGYNQTPPPASSSSSGSYPPPQQQQPQQQQKMSPGPLAPRPPAPPYSTFNSGPQPRPSMYPGGQPMYQNRFQGPPAPGGPSGGFSGSGSSASNSNWSGPSPMSGGPPRPPGPPGPPGQPFGPSHFGSSGSGWGGQGSMKPGMGPAVGYRPEMMRGGPMGAQRPGFPMGGRGREIMFPPGCVESTQPHMIKRRKHNKADIQPIDGWKLVMALKSGLLMESTWALDVLNILLYDDYSYIYFGLTNMPGLMEVLLEHWRASLIAMFGITQDLEVEREKTSVRVENTTESLENGLKEKKRQLKSKWWERNNDENVNQEEGSSEDKEKRSYDLGRVSSDLDPKDNCVLLTNSSKNFTKRPRFNDEEDEVEIEEMDEALFVQEEAKEWDNTDRGMELWSSHWQAGGGNNTSHIVDSFTSELDLVQFVRILRDQRNHKTVKGESPTIKTEEESCEKEQEQTDDDDTKVGLKEGVLNECEDKEEDIVEKITRLTGIVLRDPDLARERWQEKMLEDECYMRDDPSLHLVTEGQDSIGRRAVCVSTILRNLSFVPGNDYEFSRNAAFLTIAGRLLLLFHWYPARTAKQRNYDRGEEEDNVDSCTSLIGDNEWWWEYLHVIRENVMVVLANIAGSLELKHYDEDLVRPILHGLLEWSVSTSSYAQDPFPYLGPLSPVSPQRLAIETLCKLCLHDSNVDLLLATPPFSRIQKLTKLLAKKLYRYEDQVLREFSINILYYLSGADSGVSRTIATADQTVGLLLGFIEQAEQNAMVVAQQHGVNALRDNPDSMGTSLDMLRRSASTLNNLSKHPDNIPLFVKHEQRLLSLVMSQILDQGVAAILSNVLFNIGVEQKRNKMELEARRAKEELEVKQNEKYSAAAKEEPVKTNTSEEEAEEEANSQTVSNS